MTIEEICKEDLGENIIDTSSITIKSDVTLKSFNICIIQIKKNRTFTERKNREQKLRKTNIY